MKYLITGAAGLIGGAIISELNSRGETDILAVDHLGTSEKWKNLRSLRFDDYMEKDDLRALLDGSGLDRIGAVIHMGACSSTTETDASYLVHNNFEFTKKLACEAVRRGIPMVYASSAATYGAGENGYSDNEDGIEKLRPLNMYGYSKQLTDLWARRRGYLKHLTAVKFTNVFGPNEHHKGPMRSMVLRSWEQIRAEGKVRLFRSYLPQYADGEQKRDFIYVKDAAKMVLALLEKKAHGIYNIGSGRAETWNSLVNAAFAALGKTPQIEYIDMPEQLKGKYQYYTCADMTKFQSLGTGLSARPLAESVKDYLLNHLEKEA